jgi:hypothetical protein
VSAKFLWADSLYKAEWQEIEYGVYWVLWRDGTRVNGGVAESYLEAYDAARGYAIRDRTLRFKESMIWDTETQRWVRKDGTDILTAFREL